MVRHFFRSNSLAFMGWYFKHKGTLDLKMLLTNRMQSISVFSSSSLHDLGF